ncbi:MAG TPA: peptidoglycan-binding domain-containing protein [Solirubrobacterales bacterium]|nr:peptidoglycan-binding domain-containing protein [Solirubrobacterales bacterium]
MKLTRAIRPGCRWTLAVLALAVSLAACSPPASASTGGASQVTSSSAETPFDRQGMWVWYVSRSEEGSVSRILARAERSGIGTVYVKAGDGASPWGQFSSSLVEALHRGGLDVCAWQFVYGDAPLAEARVGAGAVAKGADCLVIDAEGEYEGKYAAADAYIRALRTAIGASFPLSLAGYPYVDYHPAFPYSVLLGPGGATYLQPQMYWRAIGTSVRAVFEHTYRFNRLWGHPIYPVGQTYESPSRREIVRFRRFALSYGGQQPSWWDWQETGPDGWNALGASTPGPFTAYRPVTENPVLRQGSKGDLVVWAQEHLLAAGAQIPVSGFFKQPTFRAVRAFQRARGLTADGVIGTSTWQALLALAPVAMPWSGSEAGTAAGGAAASRQTTPSRPLSATLPPRGDELRGGFG